MQHRTPIEASQKAKGEVGGGGVSWPRLDDVRCPASILVYSEEIISGLVDCKECGRQSEVRWQFSLELICLQDTQRWTM